MTARQIMDRTWQLDPAGRLVGFGRLVSGLPLGTSGRAVAASLVLLGLLAVAERQVAKDGFAVFQHLLPPAITVVLLPIIVSLLAPIHGERRGINPGERGTRLAWFAAIGLVIGALVSASLPFGAIGFLITPIWSYGLLGALALRLQITTAVGVVSLSFAQLAAGLVVALTIPRSVAGNAQPFLIALISVALGLGWMAWVFRRAPVDRCGPPSRRGQAPHGGYLDWIRADSQATETILRLVVKNLVWLGLLAGAAALIWLVVGGQPGLLNRLLLPLTGIAMTRLVAEELILRCQLQDPLSQRIGPAGAIFVLAAFSGLLGWLTRGGPGLTPATGDPWAAAGAAIAAAVTAGILWRRSRSPWLVVVFRLLVP